MKRIEYHAELLELADSMDEHLTAAEVAAALRGLADDVEREGLE
ncbi:MAG: hypothetical protein ABI566_03690 [Pseudolysinimonas sp.]